MQVFDLAAFLADKVNVGIGIGIETLDSIHRTQTGDDALLLEHGQVPVNRS